ncbi:Linear gramicidin dehydrogenase LgrE [compost metagenome]
MKKSPWLVPLSGDSNCSLRLFAFPFAGGSAAAYASWYRWMPRNVELIGVQLPGRAMRMGEAPIDDMNTLVSALLPHLRPLLDKPYQLFGHSNGALMTFAVLNSLLNLGAPAPQAVILSAKASPTLPRRHEPLSTLAEPEFLEKLKELDGTPQELLNNLELMRLLSPMIRADFKLGETFAMPVLNPSLAAIPAMIIGGQDDAMPLADVFAWHSLFPNCHQVTLSGGHFCINTDPQFPNLLVDFVNASHDRVGSVVAERGAVPAVAQVLVGQEI